MIFSQWHFAVNDSVVPGIELSRRGREAQLTGGQSGPGSRGSRGAMDHDQALARTEREMPDKSMRLLATAIDAPLLG